MATREEINRAVGRMAQAAIERRRDRPSLAMLQYMTEQMEIAKICDTEPDWGTMFRESRKIFLENL